MYDGTNRSKELNRQKEDPDQGLSLLFVFFKSDNITLNNNSSYDPEEKKNNYENL